ncbi:MAG: S-layer homology domain-containing protein [Oscillospiraceae bacterium]|nr:S-layer homology domain-containing protein [Oscillospiraceae bacterium]
MKKNTRRLLSLLLTVMMIASLAVTALAAESFAYDGDEVTFIKEDGSAFGMFTAQEGTSAVLAGDDVVIHYVPKNTTVYNAIHWGAVDDAELTADLAFNEDGTFDITLPKTECGKAIPIAPIKVKDGGTTDKQYYLAIPAAEKLNERIELAVTNNTKMFKVETARLDGSVLVFTLSGSGYHELVKGTYEEAVAIGDDYDKWIHGAENADGKWEFRMSVAGDESFIPVVAISNSKYTSYLNGEAPLAGAFYPRQFELDREAKTLVTGDYEYTAELAVTNNVKMFKVDSASLYTVGGPNSNNYKANLILTMGSESFDGAYVGKGEDIAEGTETIAIGEGNVFEIPVKWVKEFGKPETLESQVGKPFIMSFHSVKKDAWYDRQFIISEADGTLVINEAPAVTFTDVPYGDWYYDSVYYCAGIGLVKGMPDGSFAPAKNMNMAELTQLLYRMAGNEDAEGEYWWSAAEKWAVEVGIVTADEFKPAENVTREFFFRMFYATAAKTGKFDMTPRADITGAVDYADIDAANVDAISWAVAAGMVKGTSATELKIDPDFEMNRATACEIIMRYLKAA